MIQPTKWELLQTLSKVLGGQDTQALTNCFHVNLLPQLVDLAERHDVLPALAVRCNQQLAKLLPAANPESQRLTQALRDNTVRNMQISVQALKLTRQLNKAGITPLFLKGTVQLLDEGNENLGFRKQIDIDLLVEPEQIEAASEALLRDGHSFYDYSEPGIPALLPDTATALRVSAAHHHLPPFVKAGCVATVELHRHYLPKRFQAKNPLEPLLRTAISCQSHGASFREPSLEYQLIHLILGKLVHDGHLTRYTFPLREACDLIVLLEKSEGELNEDLITQHCGKDFSIFAALAEELMGYTANACTTTQHDVSNRIRIMRKCYSSPAFSKIMDRYARTVHLANSLVYNPAKASAYLRRLHSEK